MGEEYNDKSWPSQFKWVIFSLFIGILIMSTLTFNYTIIDSAEMNPLTNLLNSLMTWLNGYGASVAVQTIAVAYGVYQILMYRSKAKKNLPVQYIVVSVIFGFMNLCGLCMYHMDRLPFFYSKTWLFVMIPLWLSYSIMFILVAFLAENAFCYFAKDCPIDKVIDTSKPLMSKIGLEAFSVILLCWLPWVISYYPASMDWDVYRQLASFTNVSSYAHSNHDPFFSFFVIGVCYNLGKWLGSENLGVFIYIVLRDIALAAIYARVVWTLSRAGFPKLLCIVVLFYYAITPVWGAYAKHAFKDTFAAGLFCAAITSMICVIRLERNKKLQYNDCVVFAILSCFSCLFRGNVIYALLPSVVLLSILLISKKQIGYGCIALSGCLFFLVFNYSITHFGGIKPADKEEALSLPFQMSARTVRDHFEEITEEEKAALNGYLDYESMGTRYDPLVSDPVKNRAKKDVSVSTKAAYFKVFLKMISKYPVTNFEAIIASTYGYYTFAPKHGETEGNYNANMTILSGIKPSGFLEWFSNFEYKEETKKYREWLHRWSRIWDRLPLFSLTDTIAAYTWFVVLLGLWLIQHHKKNELIPVLSVLMLIGTCIASPVNDCFRYYSLAAASCPSLLLLLRNEV